MQRGSVAIESVLAISVLVVMCGGLMAIAHAAYTEDRMGRAARAAARAIALAPDASANDATRFVVACKAIKRELDLDPEFDCDRAWTISIETGLAPMSLAGGANPDGVSGDLVLVEIEWRQPPWAHAASLLEGSGAGSAFGLARREPRN